MKTKFLTFGLIAVFTLTSLAQSKQKTTTTSSSSSYYSTSVHKDKFLNSNSSVSISNSNESYKFRARFHKSKTDNVKKILLAKLISEDLGIKKGKIHLWIKNINGEEVFKCKLTKGRVKIYLNKEEVSTNYYDKIYALGEELKTLISGEDSKEDYLNAVKSAKKELERAQRSLDRAKRELERAKSKVN